MSAPHEIPMQHLLQHRAWVRRLARHLVVDEARADDLEQQTWLAALQKPPTGDTPKAWLGTVMRNLAGRMRRSEVRVDRRERAAARPERLPPTGDVVAEAELHKRVVQAVLDLEPPYRESVLHRHYEGLPPREIAEQMGVSVETVRSRVRRGMQQIRARFDHEHGGDGHTWRFALLPLAGGAGAIHASPAAQATTEAAAKTTGGALGTGALLMAVKTKLTLAALALLLLATGAWLALPDSEPEPETPPVVVGESDDGPATLNTKGTAEKALENDAPPPAAVPDSMPPSLAPGVAALRVVRAQDGRDISVRGATLRIVGTTQVHAELATDGHGRATLPVELLGTRQTIWVTAPTGVLARRELTVAAGETLIRLAAAHTAELRMVDETGNPLPPEEVKRRYETAGLQPVVTWVSNTALHDADRMLVNMFGEQAGLVMQSPLRFEEDRVLLGTVPSEGRWQLLVDRPGAGPDMSSALDASAESLVITIPLPSADAIGVPVRFVTEEDGLPIAGASVVPYFEVGDDAAFFAGSARRTDANGEVRLPKFDKGARRFQRPPTWWLSTATHACRLNGYSLIQTKPGEVFERKAYRSVSVAGRAWKRSGEPAVGCRVLFAEKGYVRSTTVTSEGTYRLTGIPYRGETARVALLEKLEMAGVQMERVPVEPGKTATFDFGQARDAAAVGRIDVTCTHGGKPLPGILFAARAENSRGKGQFGKTAADGHARFEGLKAGVYQVRLALGDVRVSDDYGGRSVAPITVVAGETLELVFDLPDGVIEVTAVDAQTGKPVASAVALANPSDEFHGAARVEGFALRLGWAERTKTDGTARLLALPRGTPLTVRYGGEGYEMGEVKNVRAGSPDEPAELEVKLVKKR